MKEAFYPLFFKPVYKEKIWSGSLLKKYTKRETPENLTKIGEIWEIVDRKDAQSIVENGIFKGKTLGELVLEYPKFIVGERHNPSKSFPLLVKIIDAGEKLSLQVHPDDKVCKQYKNAEPKTEMWYVLQVEKNAKIFVNLKDKVTKQKFLESLNSECLEDLLQVFSPRVGDAFFIPTGRIHSIGAGNLILEIQQNSDTTYRISDWGRVGTNGKPRDLHIKEAMQAIRFEDRMLPKISADLSPVNTNKKIPLIMNCPHFIVEEIRLLRTYFDQTDKLSFQILTAIDASFTIEYAKKEYLVTKGTSCLLPAALGSYRICVNEPVKIVKTTLKRYF